MKTPDWLFLKNNLLRLAPAHILVEQLRLIISNFGNTVLPSMLLALSLAWALSNERNGAILWLWCATEIVSNLNLFRYARHHLANAIPLNRARHMVWVLAILNAVHGLIWGSLSFITMETANPTGVVLVVAVVSGMVGAAMATLSPVPLLFIAFAFTQLGLMAVKLWLMGDANYRVLSSAIGLYVLSLLGLARTSARSTLEAIELRFKLAASEKRLRDIERREAITQERQRLMQDMHDGLGSSLRTALLSVEKGRAPDNAVADVLKGCIDDLKLAIDSMEPVQADLLLLLATWRFRLEPRLDETGITLLWEVADVPELDWLEPRSALHILRILQEALTNVIKHANATEIHVATATEDDCVRVSITDNGQGFALEPALHRGGKGLSNQMRRAQSIGAEVHWKSGDAGTCFSLRLPVRKGSPLAA